MTSLINIAKKSFMRRLSIFLFSLFSFFMAKAQLQRDSVGIYCCQPVLHFVQDCAAPQPGIIWVQIHENELTVPEVALKVLDSLQKGCIVRWQHVQTRNVQFVMNDSLYMFDPNRIFTPEGVVATLESQSRFDSAAAKYVEDLGKQFTGTFINQQRLVIAMHNNSDGGDLHIGSYASGGIFEADASEVNINPTLDKDDFFYVTDRRFFDYLGRKGFNVMLQNNATVTNDGSLSVYCGMRSIPYLNIEAQLGHEAEQKRMMIAVMDMISELGFE